MDNSDSEGDEVLGPRERWESDQPLPEVKVSTTHRKTGQPRSDEAIANDRRRLARRAQREERWRIGAALPRLYEERHGEPLDVGALSTAMGMATTPALNDLLRGNIFPALRVHGHEKKGGWFVSRAAEEATATLAHDHEHDRPFTIAP